jgi:hypothetical protein
VIHLNYLLLVEAICSLSTRSALGRSSTPTKSPNLTPHKHVVSSSYDCPCSLPLSNGREKADGEVCSGIFGYINYLVEKDRKFIIDTLINGLRSPPFFPFQKYTPAFQEQPLTSCHFVCLGLSRLEYRGYDSAGFAIDGDKKNEVFAFKEVGKVAKLRELVDAAKLDQKKVFDSHAGIAHTRWATHGRPSRINCHPHRYVSHTLSPGFL